MRLHRVFFLYTLTSFQILEVEKFGLGICLYPKLKLQLYGISPPFPQIQKSIELQRKLAVYPNQKTRKGILSEKTRCIPKPKDEKGYTDGKNSLYTQIKRQERVYWRKKLVVYPNWSMRQGIVLKKSAIYPKYNLSRKKYICSMLSSDSIGDIGENICFSLRSRQNFIIESWGSRKLHDPQGKNAIQVMGKQERPWPTGGKCDPGHGITKRLTHPR